MDDDNSTFGRTISALVSTPPAMAQKTTAKPAIVAAIVKLMCFLMRRLRLGSSNDFRRTCVMWFTHNRLFLRPVRLAPLLMALARGDGSREAPAWTAALKREQTAICDRRPWLLYSRLTILAVGAGASPLRTPPPSWLPQCGPIKGL